MAPLSSPSYPPSDHRPRVGMAKNRKGRRKVAAAVVWIISYRGPGEEMKEVAAWGRAAAIVAAVRLIESGIDVLGIVDRSERRSVSADEIRRIRELSHTPALQSMFAMRREPRAPKRAAG